MVCMTNEWGSSLLFLEFKPCVYKHSCTRSVGNNRCSFMSFSTDVASITERYMSFYVATISMNVLMAVVRAV